MSWGLRLPDVATFTADNCREDTKRRPAQLFEDKCRPNEERMKVIYLPLSLSLFLTPRWMKARQDADTPSKDSRSLDHL